MQAVERALADGQVTPGRSASSSTRRPWRRTRSSRGRSRAAASSRPRASATCSRSPARCGRSLYDTQFEKATPLVPRDRAVGRRRAARPGRRGAAAARGRLGARGGGDPAARGRSSRSPSASSTPTSTREHEQRVGAILAEELPGVPISLSAEVAPEFREYLRASTTVINAVIRPVVERYLERIESRLADAGVQAKLLVMQSSGGVFSSEAARSAARVHGRVRPGRRRDRLRLPRRDARPPRHPLVRHGRHDRQGRADPGRAARR